jgi:hypothetical protein
VLRRSLRDHEPRGSWPLVLCQAGKDGLLLQACQGDLALRYQQSGAYSPDAIAFCTSVLAQFEGRRDDPVELEQFGPANGQARWIDSGVPRVIDIDTVAPESAPEFPALPRELIPMPAGFLQAMDEAAKTTASEAVRYGLTRIQLRGKSGQIVATDGRHLLVQAGFPFPWSDTVLVPRVPAFGNRELAGLGEVTLGRTNTHVAVRIGPWTFVLAIDAQSRFPDIDAVVPKPRCITSRLRIDPADADFLVAAIPKLPGREGDHTAITLDVDTPPAIRAQGDGPEKSTEIVLAHSRASGPPVRLNGNRGFLHRALKLGFREIHIVNAQEPVACHDEQRMYVWMPLDPKSAIPPGPDMHRIDSAGGVITDPLPPSERSEIMPAPQSNGPSSDNGHANGGSEPERWGIAEVIAETEALRNVLHDAAGRTARLLAALKHQRRRSRAVQQAMQSLRGLQLDH